eukprot:2155790-Rhodomonas_salina.2
MRCLTSGANCGAASHTSAPDTRCVLHGGRDGGMASRMRRRARGLVPEVAALVDAQHLPPPACRVSTCAERLGP